MNRDQREQVVQAALASGANNQQWRDRITKVIVDRWEEDIEDTATAAFGRGADAERDVHFG